MTTLPKISKELKAAVNQWFVATAMVETIKPIVDKINQDWLDANKPKSAAEWGMDMVITKAFDTYLMEQSDFLKYAKETSVKKREAGFIFEGDDTCPLLIAEHDVIKAEWKILEYSECLTGEKDIHFTSMDKRKEFIKLIVKLVNSAPKKMFS